jgi:hypothetical protein
VDDVCRKGIEVDDVCRKGIGALDSIAARRVYAEGVERDGLTVIAAAPVTGEWVRAAVSTKRGKEGASCRKPRPKNRSRRTAES